MKVNGIMRVHNDLENEKMDINGMFKATGSVTTKELEGNGMMTVLKSLQATLIKFDGVLKVSGKVKAESIQAVGVFRANEVETETFKMIGKLQIEETINCDTLDCECDMTSNIKEIEARTVLIKNHKRSIHLFRTHLHCASISADEIYLENVTCDKVLGDEVRIGKNCRIAHLEYKSMCEIDPSSSVKEKIQR